ncbi:MAG: nucleotide exchange factor GrpE [Sulfurospirillum sp.]
MSKEKEKDLSEKFDEKDTLSEAEENSTNVDEIEVLNQKLQECEDKYLRINADFENIKRRMEKEKAVAISYAHEQFARDLLPIIDSLDMALNTCKNDKCDVSENLLDKVKEGIDLTIEQFKKTFEKHGIELVDINEGFDPNFHEAVMQLESQDKESGEILEVFQKGYKIKDRVLRPAMVSIVK